LKEMPTRKGQLFAYDAIIAGALFAILLAVLFIYWDAIRSLVFVQVDDMFRVALRVSDNLLTPGSPLNWQDDTNSIQKMGLAEKYGTVRIDAQKMKSLQLLSSLDYEAFRSRLGLGTYQVYIVLRTPTETIDAGQLISGSPSKISVTKPVVYKDKPATLTVTIWTPVQS